MSFARRNALSLTVRPVVGRRAKISALGTYVPPDVITNQDLEKMVETSDQWIMERTGIRERHVLAKGLGVSDICAEAAKKCLAARGMAPDEVEVIIVGTVTPDMMYPSTACLVQHKIGAHGAWGFDVSAGCSGFTYALQAGVKMVESGAHSKVLVCGADANTRMTDYTDRTTCVLFGDGGGAVLVEPAAEGEIGFIDSLNEIDGAGGVSLNMPGGGSLNPSTHETVDKKMHFIHQDGPAVYKFAVRKMAEAHRSAAGAQRCHRRGSGLLHSPSGQQAHHYGHCGSAGHEPGSRDYQYRKVRQHFVRNHPTRHGDGRRRRQAEKGRSGAAGRGGRRLHRRHSAAALGDLKASF